MALRLKLDLHCTPLTFFPFPFIPPPFSPPQYLFFACRWVQRTTAPYSKSQGEATIVCGSLASSHRHFSLPHLSPIHSLNFTVCEDCCMYSMRQTRGGGEGRDGLYGVCPSRYLCPRVCYTYPARSDKAIRYLLMSSSDSPVSSKTPAKLSRLHPFAF